MRTWPWPAWRCWSSPPSSCRRWRCSALTRVVAGHRRVSLQAVAAVSAAWVLCWVLGAQFVSGARIASTSAADLVVSEVHTVQADIQERSRFAGEIRHDRYGHTPDDRLLTSLRGKDVLLVFVESYGKVAVEGSSFSPRVDDVLDTGTEQLRSAGFDSRSGWLTSPTFGGISWLAHSTMQSGVWVDKQWKYDQLVGERSADAQSGVRGRRVADRRRRAVGQPVLAGGVVVLPLRQGLQPAERRVSRPDLRVRVRCPISTSTWPCSGSSSARPIAGRCSPRSTWCRATSRGRRCRR